MQIIYILLNNMIHVQSNGTCNGVNQEIVDNILINFATNRNLQTNNKKDELKTKTFVKNVIDNVNLM